MKLKNLIGVGFATAMLLGAGSASAAIVSTGEQASSTNQGDGTPVTNTDWTKALTFSKFNTSLGTLVGFKITINTTQDTAVTVTNAVDASSNSTGSVQTRVVTLIQDWDGGGYFVNNVSTSGGLVKTTALSDYDQGSFSDLAPGASVVVNPDAVSVSARADYSSGYTIVGNPIDITPSGDPLAGLFAAVSGSGSYVLNAITKSSVVTDITGGNNSTAQVTKADVQGFVTYYYDDAPVPIPGAVWLFGTGIVGLIGASKRKKAAALVA